MAIEAMKGAGMSYAGSSSASDVKAESQAKVETASNAAASDDLMKKTIHSEAVFGIHDATNRVTIKIVDKDTKKVLKEYPPEKTLDMIAKVWEMAGLLVDKKL